MIDPITISKIFDAAEIVDVVNDFVHLKRRGSNFQGLCPFHNEKTPSFTVSPAKGIFKCFGCGKGGNAVNFIMEHEQLSYPEALRYLAKKYGIEIQERELSDEEKKLGSEKESMLIVTKFASNYFAENLMQSEEGISIGLRYFRERGFSKQIINDFKLGYSPEERDAFTKDSLKNGYKLEFLEKTGLSIVKENFNFDRFAGRVMFPIFSLSGQVIGFGGRTLKTDKNIAKYLNSPESAIYSKSKVLYGLFQAKQEIIKKEKCYLVEGYTDVLSFHKADIKNVVASSGTSLTEDQIRLIHRFTNDVTILYDADSAGIKASLRGTDMLLEQGLNVRILLFPEGEDPDSFAQKHSSSETLEYIRKNEQDFISFKAQLLSDEAKNDPIKRAALISDIVRSISVIDDKIKQSVYIQECSNIMNINETVLYAEVAKITRRKIQDLKQKERSHSLLGPSQNIPPVPAFVDKVYFEAQEHEIIRLLLLYGNEKVVFVNHESKENVDVKVADYIIDQLRNDELEMKNILNQKIFLLAEQIIKSNEKISADFFTQHQDPEISQLSASLCSQKHQLSQIWKRKGAQVVDEEKKLNELLEDLFRKYKLNIVKEAKNKLQQQLKDAKTTNKPEQILSILEKISQINEVIKKLSELQGRVIM
ncbi:MAG: DNA primase [Bacteroidales bacterium]|nr:DNA primase [Bacteroidales bacterium]MDD4216321.1 DNA primase [Bacteroidales bacterium]MDY0140870.1 DNA primase [Bacteroidales bacterium]